MPWPDDDLPLEITITPHGGEGVEAPRFDPQSTSQEPVEPVAQPTTGRPWLDYSHWGEAADRIGQIAESFGSAVSDTVSDPIGALSRAADWAGSITGDDVARGAEDFTRGFSDLPYQTIGAIPDLVGMGLNAGAFMLPRPAWDALNPGFSNPIGGSEWLRDLSQQAGIAQPRTGSPAETAGTIAGGFTHPPSAIRGAQKAQGALRALKPNKLGLWSHGFDVSRKMPDQQKGNWQQTRATLLNKGVKEDELVWTGFDERFKPLTPNDIAEYLDSTIPLSRTRHPETREFLSDAFRALPDQPITLEQLKARAAELGFGDEIVKLFDNPELVAAFGKRGRPITKADLTDHFRRNQPRIKQTVYAEDFKKPMVQESWRESEPGKGDYDYRGFELYDPANGTVDPNLHFPTREEALAHIAALPQPASGATGKDRFGPKGNAPYTVPGLEDYRERIWSVPDDFARPGSTNQYAYTNPTHWPGLRNFFAHDRGGIRKFDDGTPYINVEEMQSDAGQAYRDLRKSLTDQYDRAKKSYDHKMEEYNLRKEAGDPDAEAFKPREVQKVPEGKPELPYTASPDRYSQFILKQALWDAANRGIKDIVFTSGTEQAHRWSKMTMTREYTFNPATRETQALNISGYDRPKPKKVKNEAELAAVVGPEKAKQMWEAADKIDEAKKEFSVKYDKDERSFKVWNNKLNGWEPEPRPYGYSGRLADSKEYVNKLAAERAGLIQPNSRENYMITAKPTTVRPTGDDPFKQAYEGIGMKELNKILKGMGLPGETPQVKLHSQVLHPANPHNRSSSMLSHVAQERGIDYYSLSQDDRLKLSDELRGPSLGHHLRLTDEQLAHIKKKGFSRYKTGGQVNMDEGGVPPTEGENGPGGYYTFSADMGEIRRLLDEANPQREAKEAPKYRQVPNPEGGWSTIPDELSGRMAPSMSPSISGLEGLQRALEPDPEATYGSILPFAYGGDETNAIRPFFSDKLRWAMPSSVRNAARGVVDMLGVPDTGVVTAPAMDAIPNLMMAGNAPAGALTSGTRNPFRHPLNYYSGLSNYLLKGNKIPESSTAYQWNKALEKRVPGARAELEAAKFKTNFPNQNERLSSGELSEFFDRQLPDLTRKGYGFGESNPLWFQEPHYSAMGMKERADLMRGNYQAPRSSAREIAYTLDKDRYLPEIPGFREWLKLFEQQRNELRGGPPLSGDQRDALRNLSRKFSPDRWNSEGRDKYLFLNEHLPSLNVAGHLRVQDVNSIKGGRPGFLGDEQQSDLTNLARQYGHRDSTNAQTLPSNAKPRMMHDPRDPNYGQYVVQLPRISERGVGRTPEEAMRNAADVWERWFDSTISRLVPPNLPFAGHPNQTEHMLANMMLQEAAKANKEFIALTPGATQVDRWTNPVFSQNHLLDNITGLQGVYEKKVAPALEGALRRYYGYEGPGWRRGKPYLNEPLFQKPLHSNDPKEFRPHILELPEESRQNMIDRGFPLFGKSRYKAEGGQIDEGFDQQINPEFDLLSDFGFDPASSDAPDLMEMGFESPNVMPSVKDNTALDAYVAARGKPPAPILQNLTPPQKESGGGGGDIFGTLLKLAPMAMSMFDGGTSAAIAGGSGMTFSDGGQANLRDNPFRELPTTMGLKRLEDPEGRGELDAIFSHLDRIAPLLEAPKTNEVEENLRRIRMGLPELSRQTYAEGGPVSIDDEMQNYGVMFYREGGPINVQDDGVVRSYSQGAGGVFGGVPGGGGGGGGMMPIIGTGMDIYQGIDTLSTPEDQRRKLTGRYEMDPLSNVWDSIDDDDPEGGAAGYDIGKAVGNIAYLTPLAPFAPFIKEGLGRIGSGVEAWVTGKGFGRGLENMIEGTPFDAVFAEGGQVPGFAEGGLADFMQNMPGAWNTAGPTLSPEQQAARDAWRANPASVNTTSQWDMEGWHTWTPEAAAAGQTYTPPAGVQGLGGVGSGGRGLPPMGMSTPPQDALMNMASTAAETQGPQALTMSAMQPPQGALTRMGSWGGGAGGGQPVQGTININGSFRRGGYVR